MKKKPTVKNPQNVKSRTPREKGSAAVTSAPKNVAVSDRIRGIDEVQIVDVVAPPPYFRCRVRAHMNLSSGSKVTYARATIFKVGSTTPIQQSAMSMESDSWYTTPVLTLSSVQSGDVIYATVDACWTREECQAFTGVPAPLP
jgi:hypothetical protein